MTSDAFKYAIEAYLIAQAVGFGLFAIIIAVGDWRVRL